MEATDDTDDFGNVGGDGWGAECREWGAGAGGADSRSEYPENGVDGVGPDYGGRSWCLIMRRSGID